VTACATKYLGQPGLRVFELGLVFAKTERNLVQYGWKDVVARI